MRKQVSGVEDAAVQHAHGAEVVLKAVTDQQCGLAQQRLHPPHHVTQARCDTVQHGGCDAGVPCVVVHDGIVRQHQLIKDTLQALAI